MVGISRLFVGEPHFFMAPPVATLACAVEAMGSCCHIAPLFRVGIEGIRMIWSLAQLAIWLKPETCTTYVSPALKGGAIISHIYFRSNDL